MYCWIIFNYMYFLQVRIQLNNMPIFFSNQQILVYFFVTTME
jgi:hypothetical protein